MMKQFYRGDTAALIEEEYYFTSKNVKYLKNEQQILSRSASIEDENGNIYKTDNFLYLIKDRLLKGSNLNIISKIMKKKR